jgi:hypothetical protein
MTTPPGNPDPTPWQRKLAAAQRLAECLFALRNANELLQLALTDWRLEFDDDAITQVIERSDAPIGHVRR